jgi:starch-binding outer membrane protein, SusD/RagB family
MKKAGLPLLLLLLVLSMNNSCRKDFLEITPGDFLDETKLANEKGIETLLVGVYSMLDGVSPETGSWEAASSNWLFGSVRGMEANIGTDSGTESDIGAIQDFRETATHSYLNPRWKSIYEAISRCNNAIMVINLALQNGTISSEKAGLFIKETKTLRGWFHFEAWRMWNMVPYLDENTNPARVTNKTDIRPMIISDITEGTSLPDNMGHIGKFNGTVAKVLLAKAYMQMNHDYASALPLLLSAKTGTKPDGSPIGLAKTYGEIFEIVNRNGIEAVYTVQYSVNDGSGGYNGGMGEALNFPYKQGASPAGCCGFFQPTQEFVNSFTTVNGLPLLDNSYNSLKYQNLRDQGVPGGGPWDSLMTYQKNGYSEGDLYYYGNNSACTVYDPVHPFTDMAFVSKTYNNTGNNPLKSPDTWSLKWVEDNYKPVDPRLDWTVGRRGIPYWDWGVHTGSDWIRDQLYAGPYSPKKQVYKKSDEGKYTENGSWTTGFTANGYRMIRFADILLLTAECQIETGDLQGALVNINLVRSRAANPDGFVKEADGKTPAALYDIKTYSSFPDKDYARKALRMERKLELGMEGHRWFDLNRWGTTVEELNRAIAYERKTSWGRNLYWNTVVGPEDVTYPIPQIQIDRSYGNLIQNR